MPARTPLRDAFYAYERLPRSNIFRLVPGLFFYERAEPAPASARAALRRAARHCRGRARARARLSFSVPFECRRTAREARRRIRARVNVRSRGSDEPRRPGTAAPLADVDGRRSARTHAKRQTGTQRYNATYERKCG